MYLWTPIGTGALRGEHHTSQSQFFQDMRADQKNIGINKLATAAWIRVRPRKAKDIKIAKILVTKRISCETFLNMTPAACQPPRPASTKKIVAYQFRLVMVMDASPIAFCQPCNSYRQRLHHPRSAWTAKIGPTTNERPMRAFKMSMVTTAEDYHPEPKFCES